MTTPTVLITDMAILVGIFLLGFWPRCFHEDGRRRKK